MSGYGSTNTVVWTPSVFDFKKRSGRATCPTCHGIGKIPRGHEDELVALIPYNDKRLKPQRKCLLCCIGLIVLLLVLGLTTTLMAILYPRHLDINVVQINSTQAWGLDNYSSKNVVLEIKVTLSTTNNNFFSVSVSKLASSVASLETEVGSIVMPPFYLESRSKSIVVVVQNCTFSDGIANRVRVICTNKNWDNHNIYLETTIALSYNYLSQDYDSFLSNGSYVDCGQL